MEPYQTPEAEAYARLLNYSFRHWTGVGLLPEEFPIQNDAELVEALWDAPFGLVSHGTEDDPIFRYGNKLGLSLFEMGWDEFTRLPSRLSAEPATSIQDDRNRLMADALKHGWVRDYRGVRVSKNGWRFELVQTILWNVVDARGRLHGQAARINGWRSLPSPSQG